MKQTRPLNWPCPWVVAALAFCLAAAGGRGQPATSTAVSTNAALTLEALVAEVLENNPELSFYEAELAAAKGARRQAGIYEPPELSASGGIKRVAGRGGSSEGAAWSASVLQTFEFPGRMSLRKAIANQDMHLAELGLAQFKGALSARARTLGYNLILARRKAQAATEVANRMQELLDFLVQRDPAGITPLLEVRVIEAGVLTFRKQAIEASQALQSALFEVNILRGQLLDTPLALAEVELIFPPVPDRERLLESARARNIEVRARLAELEQQGFRLALSKNQRWPELGVGPVVEQEKAGDRETVVGIGISLPLPLWNRNAGNIETERARQHQAEVSLFLVRLRTEQAVMEHWLAYRLKAEEMQRWHPNSIERFHQAAALGDRHYRLGSLPIATYIELQREYLDALNAILSLQSEALNSWQQLEVLTQTQLSEADQPSNFRNTSTP